MSKIQHIMIPKMLQRAPTLHVKYQTSSSSKRKKRAGLWVKRVSGSVLIVLIGCHFIDVALISFFVCYIKHRWEFRWRESWHVWGQETRFRGIWFSSFMWGEKNARERKPYSFSQVWKTAGKWNCAPGQFHRMWEDPNPQKEQHIPPEVHDGEQRCTRAELWSQTKHRRGAQQDQTICALPNSV